MRIVKISSEKITKVGEHIEKALRYMGKAMQCVEDLNNDEAENERKGDYDEDDDYREHEYSNARGSRHMGRNRY